MRKDTELLLGKKFDKLLVIDYTYKLCGIKKPNKYLHWVCLCDCGNIAIIRKRDLVIGKSTSCGCFQKEKLNITRTKNRENLVGMKFGRLLVIESEYKQLGKDNYSFLHWLCKCACGKTKSFR